MKFLNFAITCLIFLGSCKSTKINYDTSFWGELEENQNYLFRKNDQAAITDGELNTGSVLLFGNSKGDYHEVFISKRKKNGKTKRVKHYLYKPKYRRVGAYSSTYSEKLVRADVELPRIYYTGKRGGCYYVNSKDNRIYVDRSFCKMPKVQKTSASYRLSPSSRSSSGGDVHVKGHYRTTKSGKRVYVKPHTRKH